MQTMSMMVRSIISEKNRGSANGLESTPILLATSRPNAAAKKRSIPQPFTAVVIQVTLEVGWRAVATTPRRTMVVKDVSTK